MTIPASEYASVGYCFETYSRAYYFRRKMFDPGLWVIKRVDDVWFVVPSDFVEEGGDC